MLLLIEYPISYSTLVLFPRYYARTKNSYTRMMAARVPQRRAKGKVPDIERASSDRAKNKQTKGKLLNNSKIRKASKRPSNQKGARGASVASLTPSLRRSAQVTEKHNGSSESAEKNSNNRFPSLWKGKRNSNDRLPSLLKGRSNSRRGWPHYSARLRICRYCYRIGRALWGQNTLALRQLAYRGRPT